MSRYGDVTALLDDTSELRRKLESAYQDAKSSPNIKEVLKPTVKSALEHLRSSLEFCGQDLRERYCAAPGPRDRVYFPFGETERRFSDSASKNLPKLGVNAPLAFELVKSLQPFACGDRWLVTLCEETNFNKHNALSKQIRVDSPESSMTIGKNAIVLRGASNVTFKGGSIDGVLLPHRSVTISSNDEAVEAEAKLGVEVRRLFDWVEFRFERSAEDTLALIGAAHDRISRFARELQAFL
jgi:hypothetical protein